MADISACIPTKWIANHREPVTARAKGWLMLIAWIAAIALFMLDIGPALLQRSALQPMAEMIEERGIEANMYFYTEVEVFYEANVNMDNTWAYPHKR
jgi:hypothetical protein